MHTRGGGNRSPFLICVGEIISKGEVSTRQEKSTTSINTSKNPGKRWEAISIHFPKKGVRYKGQASETVQLTKAGRDRPAAAQIWEEKKRSIIAARERKGGRVTSNPRKNRRGRDFKKRERKPRRSRKKDCRQVAQGERKIRKLPSRKRSGRAKEGA